MSKRKAIPLYDVPRNTLIEVAPTEEEIRTPVAGLKSFAGARLTFKHLDGMYSLCINEEGDTVHLAGWTEVYIIN